MEKYFGFGDMWDEKNVKKIEIPIGDQRRKGSIKGDVIREHHPVGPQADRKRGQGSEALGTFTKALAFPRFNICASYDLGMVG